MADMTDANDVEGSEGLMVGFIGCHAKGKYLEKDFCRKVAGRAR
jgi:hypothetical protein